MGILRKLGRKHVEIARMWYAFLYLASFYFRSVCGYGTVSVVENATGTVPYSQRNRNGIR